MTIQQLPGWWDTIKGDVLPLVDNISRGIAPNFYAQKKLEEIMSQNPQLIGQLENMNPEARAKYAESLGFKKRKNPFANLQEGQKIKDQRRLDAAWLKATPAQVGEAEAGLIGARPQATIAREQVVQGQQDVDFATRQEEAGRKKESDNLRISLDKYKLPVLMKQIDEQAEGFKKYPDLSVIRVDKVADDILHERPVDPILMQRIQGNEGVFAQFNEHVETRRLATAAEMLNQRERIRENRADKRAVDSDFAERGRAIGVGLVQSNTFIDNNVNELNKLLADDMNLRDWVNREKGWEKNPPSPETITKYQNLIKQRADLQERASLYSAAYDVYTSKLEEMQAARNKIEAKVATQIEKAGPPPDEKAAQVDAMITSGAITLDAVLARKNVPEPYKVWLRQKYGKK